MSSRIITVKKMTKAMTTALLMLAVSVAFFIISEVSVNAADNVALTVKLDGKVKKTYTMSQLEKLPYEEDGYMYSCWNTYPACEKKGNVYGPTIDTILKDAGLRSKVTDTSYVAFDGCGYKVSLTGKQLFGEKRYYYPNIENISSADGIDPNNCSDAYEGREEVPAIIALNDGTLYVGQVAPNEENKPLFTNHMTGNDGVSGIINVHTDTAPRCSQIKVNIKSGSLVPFDENNPTQLVISDIEESNNTPYDKVYYTLCEESLKDKFSPGYGSKIYNWGTKEYPYIYINPVLNEPGVYTLKVRVKGYGKQDSSLQTFTYYVGPALTVKVVDEDGQVEQTKSYETLAELKEKFTEESDLTYSGYNTYPAFSKKKSISGIKVKDIIKDATNDFNIDNHLDDALITFKTESDGASSTFTLRQLFSDRFYYPNATAGTNNTGGAATSAAYEGKVKVPVIIETTGDNTLELGQNAPNDQNFAECIHKMLLLGSIEIRKQAEMPKCVNVNQSKPSSGSTVISGTSITFPFPSSNEDKRMKTYYIVDPVDGDNPTAGDAIYNYAAYWWPKKIVNAPVLKQPGEHTIAVRNICYGRLDSDVEYYTYTVEPGKVANIKAASQSYNSVKLNWTTYSGATGYKIYRSLGSGAAKVIATITSGKTKSYINKGLKTGSTYKYYVVATGIKSTSGKLVNSKKSSVVSARPIPGTTIVKLTAGSKQIKIKWSKVSGANGYVIYRSTKKTSGFKAIKTIKKGTTLSYTNKKLKSRKTYYYKVKAYRIVSKKKIYGNYSTVKYTKTK